MKQTFLILGLLIYSVIVPAQDSLLEQIIKYDTIKAKPFTVKQVVAFKYNRVTLLLNYNTVLEYTIKMTETSHNKHISKSILSRLKKDISKNDTVHLDQAYFIKLNWIPYTALICYELQNGTCLIKDADNILHSTFIVAHAIIKAGDIYVWGGKLYFLIGGKIKFIKCTEWES